MIGYTIKIKAFNIIFLATGLGRPILWANSSYDWIQRDLSYVEPRSRVTKKAYLENNKRGIMIRIKKKSIQNR